MSLGESVPYRKTTVRQLSVMDEQECVNYAKNLGLNYKRTDEGLGNEAGWVES